MNPCQINWSLFFSQFDIFLYTYVKPGNLFQMFEPEVQASEPQYIINPGFSLAQRCSYGKDFCSTKIKKVGTLLGPFLQTCWPSRSAWNLDHHLPLLVVFSGSRCQGFWCKPLFWAMRGQATTKTHWFLYFPCQSQSYHGSISPWTSLPNC